MLFVRLFDLRFFGFNLFPLPLGVWEGLRFVIVALPGLFSYLFFLHFFPKQILNGITMESKENAHKNKEKG